MPVDQQQQLTIMEEGGVIQRAPSILEIFAQLARDPAVDVARIQQLMELQERAEERDAEKQFIAAMNRLQPKLPRITKRGKIAFESQRTGTSQNTPYARFEDIDEKIRPLLQEESFSISFGTSALEKGGIIITATLSHAGGHSRTESMPLPFDTSGSKNAIQAVGSTMAYGKRYLTCAMLNIITVDEDDDANTLSFVDEAQVNSIMDLIIACEMDDKSQAAFREFMSVEKIQDIRKSNYKKAMTALHAKFKKWREAHPEAS